MTCPERAYTILNRRSAGPILRVPYSYSHGSDLLVRHTRAVVCSETFGSWQGPMLLCRILRPWGIDGLWIMVFAIVTAPKNGIARR